MIKEKLNLRRSTFTKWLLILTIGFFCLQATAQQSFVTGVVTDSGDGSPIPGVSVVIKGTTKGTITDLDGKFTIKVNQGKSLLFRFVGMKPVEKVVKGGVLNVKLQEESVGLEEVVAIGYGTQKRKEISGAVSQIKSETLTKIVTSDLGSALQGQIAGVNVQASSGEPGADSNIQIRGVASITGSNSPLYVVDGIPFDGNPNLSSDEIATMDILKDAASCAIYGSRGAAGVILITTKKGKQGTTKISLNSSVGVQKITSGIELMDFDDYFYTLYKIAEQTEDNTHADSFWTNLWTNPDNYTNNTNIVDEVQMDNGLVQNHSLNISGGQKDVRFSVVGTYFKQDGMIINSGYERFNLRANATIKRNRWQFNVGLGAKIDEKESSPYNMLYYAYNYKPYQQAIRADQVEAFDAGKDANDAELTQVGNVMYRFLQSDVKNGEQFNGNFNAKYNIAKGLDLSTRVGFNYGNSTRKVYNPPMEMYDMQGEKVEKTQFRSKMKQTADRSTSFTMENMLSYNKRIGKHNIRLLGAFSLQESTYSQFWASKMDFISPDVTTIGGGTADPAVGSGSGQWTQDRTTKTVGMLGRLQYNYKGRYMYSASIRRDGSSRFNTGQKFKYFPSTSFAWNVADEQFFKRLNSKINAFKLRASYGTTGNDSMADYAYASVIETGYDYAFGDGNLKTGATQATYNNIDTEWETSEEINFGADLGLFKNRLTFSADIYQSKKKDMLFPLLLPISMGAGTNKSVTLNVGNMENKGIELAAGWRQSGKVSWGINGTFSKNENTITKMHESTKISYFSSGYVTQSNADKITAIKEGHEAGSFFVMETDGIVNTEAKLAEFQKILPTAKMGDLIYKDQNGDGKIDDEDRVYGGSGMPDYELGLNANVAYKGFDLSMQWYASIGNEIINGARMYAMKKRTHQDLLYQWSEQNPYSDIPVHRGESHWNFRDWSDIWIEDGSFVRLRNVTLGYTLPKSLSTKASITKCRFYLAADNPLTVTKYKGYDPEVGGNGLATRGLDRGNYPIASKYRVGVQLDF